MALYAQLAVALATFTSTLAQAYQPNKQLAYPLDIILKPSKSVSDPDSYDRVGLPPKYDANPNGLPNPDRYAEGYGPILGDGEEDDDDPFKTLREEVLSRIENQKSELETVTEFRENTLDEIDKMSELITAWCRSKNGLLFEQVIRAK